MLLKAIYGFSTTLVKIPTLIMLSEIRQLQKDKYCMITLIWAISSQIYIKRKQNEGCQGSRAERMDLLFNKDGVSVWDNKEVIELDGECT